jgi:hypothetical protein
MNVMARDVDGEPWWTLAEVCAVCMHIDGLARAKGPVRTFIHRRPTIGGSVADNFQSARTLSAQE